VVWAWGANANGQLGDGTSEARTRPVAVSDTGFAWNSPPIARAGGPYRWTVGREITFDATESSDPDGDIASYRWEYGDGPLQREGAIGKHTYFAAGTYTATVRVTDANGVSTTDSAVVTVLPAAATSKVVWTSLTGAAATGNTLTKTATTTAWDAGGVSRQRILAGDSYVEFTAQETDRDRMAGLGHASSARATEANRDVDFGIHLRDDASAEVSDSGTAQGAPRPYASGDRFRVSVEAGLVRYIQNGRVLHTTIPLRTRGTDVVEAEADTSWTIAGVGDFNGDHHPDVLWRHSVTARTASGS
jgi:hypothetical protein